MGLRKAQLAERAVRGGGKEGAEGRNLSELRSFRHNTSSGDKIFADQLYYEIC